MSYSYGMEVSLSIWSKEWEGLQLKTFLTPLTLNDDSIRRVTETNHRKIFKRGNNS
jgi:hypothetical protein